MPRSSRIDAPGAVHHIIIRRIDQGKIFEDDEDRKDFLDRLDACVQEISTEEENRDHEPKHAASSATGRLTSWG